MLRSRAEYALRVFYWVTRTLYHTTQFVGALATLAAAGLFASAISFLAGNPFLAVVITSFAAGILLMLLATVLDYARGTGPRRWLLRGYRWSSADYHYMFFAPNGEQQRQLVGIDVQALRPGISHIENRYSYFGSGSHKISIESKNHSLMGPVHERGGWSYYFIWLGRDLATGERETIHIKQEIADPNRTAPPFLSKTVVEPISSLSLKVSLPPALCPETVRRVTYIGDGPNEQVVSQPETHDMASEGCSHAWTIPHPGLGARYALEWTWPAGSGWDTAVDLPS